MENIIGILNHLRDTLVKELLDHDVTILSIHIGEDMKSGSARYDIHCRMDEWFITWAYGYYHHREQFDEKIDQEYVPFFDGKVFALYLPEDL